MLYLLYHFSGSVVALGPSVALSFVENFSPWHTGIFVPLSSPFAMPLHPGNPGQSPEGRKTDVCVHACVRVKIAKLVINHTKF